MNKIVWPWKEIASLVHALHHAFYIRMPIYNITVLKGGNMHLLGICSKLLNEWFSHRNMVGANYKTEKSN